MPAPPLSKVLASLEELYGRMAARITDPFEMILLENVAYLVDDQKRDATFSTLRQRIGLTPTAILGHTAEQIADAIREGGMKPMMRAEKVLEAARTAEGIGDLSSVVKNDPARAKKLLRGFPSIGEPYADRILLFAGTQRSIAADSNILRVLTRLGYITEEPNYAAMYRAAIAATAKELSKITTARRAHLLLRRHGRELCKRTSPRCEVCPLRPVCAYYASSTGAV